VSCCCFRSVNDLEIFSHVQVYWKLHGSAALVSVFEGSMPNLCTATGNHNRIKTTIFYQFDAFVCNALMMQDCLTATNATRVHYSGHANTGQSQNIHAVCQAHYGLRQYKPSTVCIWTLKDFLSPSGLIDCQPKVGSIFCIQHGLCHWVSQIEDSLEHIILENVVHAVKLIQRWAHLIVENAIFPLLFSLNLIILSALSPRWFRRCLAIQNYRKFVRLVMRLQHMVRGMLARLHYLKFRRGVIRLQVRLLDFNRLEIIQEAGLSPRRGSSKLVVYFG
jgi:hypothetical protein